MISVIIPTYNRAALLDLTLASLEQQNAEKSRYEVIVVDDGSADHTRDVVTSYEGRLDVKYWFQEDRGFRVAKARNLGAENSQGDVLAFIDCGVVVGTSFVNEQLTRHQAAPRDAALGYVYAFNNYKTFEHLPTLVSFRAPDEAKLRLEQDAEYDDVREGNYREIEDEMSRLPLPWSLFWTTNLAVPRQAFQDVGGFDEKFVNWGMEDVDLGFRLFEAGCPITLSRATWGIHYPHERNNAVNFGSNDLNKEQFLRKHPGIPQELYLLSTGLELNRNYHRFQRRLRALERAPSACLSREFRERVASIIGNALIVGLGASEFGPLCPDGLCLEYDERLCKGAPRPTNVKSSLGLRVPTPEVPYAAALLLSVDQILWDDYLTALSKELSRVSRARFAICSKDTIGTIGAVEVLAEDTACALIRIGG